MKLLFSRRPGLGVVLLTLCCGLPSPASVRITEIMYHPSSEDVREEFIELYNTGTTKVNLAAAAAAVVAEGGDDEGLHRSRCGVLAYAPTEKE